MISWSSGRQSAEGIKTGAWHSSRKAVSLGGSPRLVCEPAAVPASSSLDSLWATRGLCTLRLGEQSASSLCPTRSCGRLGTTLSLSVTPGAQSARRGGAHGAGTESGPGTVPVTAAFSSVLLGVRCRGGLGRLPRADWTSVAVTCRSWMSFSEPSASSLFKSGSYPGKEGECKLPIVSSVKTSRPTLILILQGLLN